MKKIIASAAIAASLALAGQAFAAAPAQPNCLGSDLSGFTKIIMPFGAFVKSVSSGGVDEEILAHLQGIPTISSCPDNGFPTPLH